MNKKTITIDGSKFSDLPSFYTEIDNVLTKNLNWETGHNLNAFNDLLHGGFGVYEYEEPVKLVWTNFSRSKLALGQELINTILEIISDHNHIEFTTTDI